MKILVISRGAWRDGSNEGSVFTNLFLDVDAEFANIYCSPGLPQNSICNSYFQLTDKMAVDNIIHKKTIGAEFNYKLSEASKDNQKLETENKSFYDFFRQHNLEIFYTARELLWGLANFKNSSLTEFVKSFKPDLIFAPLCYSSFVLKVQRVAIKACNAPAVSYIYDDIYSLKQFRFSPFFWINRFALRSSVRKNMKLFSFAYTMTEQQQKEYKKLFNCDIKVLRKSAEAQIYSKHNNGIVQIIYAGGIYYGREKTLCRIAGAIKKANKQKICARLVIYSSSPLSNKTRKILDDGVNSKINNVVSFDALKQIYAQSDIALHVEDFSLKNSLITRLSFSTKIVDCLASGCAVLAVGPENNAGIQYLKANNSAYCVTSKREIENSVFECVHNPELITTIAQNAHNCAQANHKQDRNKEQLINDFNKLLEPEK